MLSITLIRCGDDFRWETTLRNALLKQRASLQIIDIDKDYDLDMLDKCELAILDSSYINLISQITSSIRARYPMLQIVVVSPAPGWQEAKDVILNGANDYQLKSSEEKEVQRIIEKNLKICNSKNNSKMS